MTFEEISQWQDRKVGVGSEVARLAIYIGNHVLGRSLVSLVCRSL